MVQTFRHRERVAKTWIHSSASRRTRKRDAGFFMFPVQEKNYPIDRVVFSSNYFRFFAVFFFAVFFAAFFFAAMFFVL